MKGKAYNFRIKSGKNILHSVDLQLTRWLHMCVKILTFVSFGFEDICHRISFLKTKPCVSIWMYVLCILLNFILFVQEMHNIY